MAVAAVAAAHHTISWQAAMELMPVAADLEDTKMTRALKVKVAQGKE